MAVNRFSVFDHECMTQALRLAEKGLYSTHPNPRVGCVIARDGEVVGTGFHRVAGEDHAEIAALKDAGGNVSGATAYVTLEPCSHTGRTGPCATALLEAGVRRVVAAVADPNPQVDGAGFGMLRAAGIGVETGLMESAARELNCGFFSRITRGRPWVRVKTAQSLDGRTALANGNSKWITSGQSRADVQHWRARSDAILTGIDTVIADDPRMTVRNHQIEQQPLRVITDSQFRIDRQAKILAPADRALVAGCHATAEMDCLKESSVECLLLPEDPVNGRVNLSALLNTLGERGINEVQVEAGATLCGSLLKAGLVDEILLYQAPKLLGIDAAPAFSIGPLEQVSDGLSFEVREVVKTGPDFRYRIVPVEDN